MKKPMDTSYYQLDWKKERWFSKEDLYRLRNAFLSGDLFALRIAVAVCHFEINCSRPEDKRTGKLFKDGSIVLDPPKERYFNDEIWPGWVLEGIDQTIETVLVGKSPNKAGRSGRGITAVDTRHVDYHRYYIIKMLRDFGYTNSESYSWTAEYLEDGDAETMRKAYNRVVNRTKENPDYYFTAERLNHLRKIDVPKFSDFIQEKKRMRE